MALPTVPERATVSPLFFCLKFFVHSTTIMPWVNHHTVTGNVDIPVRNHIRTADMSLFARGMPDITGSGAPMVLAPDSALSQPRGGRALSYCCQW